MYEPSVFLFISALSSHVTLHFFYLINLRHQTERKTCGQHHRCGFLCGQEGTWTRPCATKEHVALIFG